MDIIEKLEEVMRLGREGKLCDLPAHLAQALMDSVDSTLALAEKEQAARDNG